MTSLITPKTSTTNHPNSLAETASQRAADTQDTQDTLVGKSFIRAFLKYGTPMNQIIYSNPLSPGFGRNEQLQMLMIQKSAITHQIRLIDSAQNEEKTSLQYFSNLIFETANQLKPTDLDQEFFALNFMINQGFITNPTCVILYWLLSIKNCESQTHEKIEAYFSKHERNFEQELDNHISALVNIEFSDTTESRAHSNSPKDLGWKDLYHDVIEPKMRTGIVKFYQTIINRNLETLKKEKHNEEVMQQIQENFKNIFTMASTLISNPDKSKQMENVQELTKFCYCCKKYLIKNNVGDISLYLLLISEISQIHSFAQMPAETQNPDWKTKFVMLNLQQSYFSNKKPSFLCSPDFPKHILKLLDQQLEITTLTKEQQRGLELIKETLKTFFEWSQANPESEWEWNRAFVDFANGYYMHMDFKYLLLDVFIACLVNLHRLNLDVIPQKIKTQIQLTISDLEKLNLVHYWESSDPLHPIKSLQVVQLTDEDARYIPDADLISKLNSRPTQSRILYQTAC